MTTLIELLQGILEKNGSIVEISKDERICTCGLILAERQRFVMLKCDGHAQVAMLFFLRSRDSLGKKGVRRLRKAIEAIAEDEPFGGCLVAIHRTLWWKVETLFPSQADSIHEVFERMIIYAR